MPFVQAGCRSCEVRAARAVGIAPVRPVADHAGAERGRASMAAIGKEAARPDRYVTFRDIDFEGNMAVVLGHLRRQL